MSNHRLYRGDELENLPHDINKPIIEGVLWENSFTILVGREGLGKSIISFQMALNISCGESFLHKFKTIEHPVVYFQAEGTLSETSDRLRNMREVLSWNSENFSHIFYPSLVLNDVKGIGLFTKMIDDNIERTKKVPKLIIIDPLYMCIRGKMTDDDVASEFCRTMAILKNKYNASILLIHHEKRPQRDDKGNSRFEKRDSFYGNMVWAANVDTMLGFNNIKGDYRKIERYKQRGGNIIESLDLTFIHPKPNEKGPLMFEEKSDTKAVRRIVEINIEKRDITARDIEKSTGIPYGSIQSVITELKRDKLIEKVNHIYPPVWRFIGKKA